MVKVLAGAPCGKMPVYSTFHDCFSDLQLPAGSYRLRVMGGSVPQNLNGLVDAAQEKHCTHLFIVEDDSEFAPDTVTRLLAHGVPVVAGLCRARSAPFLPYIYKGQDETGLKCYIPKSTDTRLIGGIGYATGLGGILIDMDVFRVIPRPYFHHYFVGETEWGQDIVFGKTLMDYKVPTYCDMDVPIGHATQCVVGSKYDNGGWRTTLKVTGLEIVLPYTTVVPEVR